MECRTKDELEQHLSDIRRLAASTALASEERDAAVRAERFAIGLLTATRLSQLSSLVAWPTPVTSIN
jgi:hypothetical protein